MNMVSDRTGMPIKVGDKVAIDEFSPGVVYRAWGAGQYVSREVVGVERVGFSARFYADRTEVISP